MARHPDPGDVQVNQDPFRMFLAYIIDDDILSRHILMEDLSILKERPVRLHCVPKDLDQLEVDVKVRRDLPAGERTRQVNIRFSKKSSASSVC